MEPLTVPPSRWVSSRTMWKAFQETHPEISFHNFLTYLSRSRHRMTVRPVRGRFRRKYRLEDLPLVASTAREFFAVKEARRIAAAADASGDWLTWQDMLRRCGEINPTYGKDNRLRTLLHQKGYPIATLFPGGKHLGRNVYHYRLQRWLLADLPPFLQTLRRFTESPRRPRFAEVQELPEGAPWLPLRTLGDARCAKARHRLTRAAGHGVIRAVLYQGKIFIDAAEATEFLNWRARPWLTKQGWSHQQLKAREAWQQSVGLTCPWGNDRPNSLAIFAPEFCLV